MKIRRELRLLWDGRFGPLPRPQRWVFIVGCYNSGTTLLHQLLASHRAIGSMVREGQFCTDELPLPRDAGLSRLWALDAERFCLREGEGRNIDVERLKRHWGARYNDPRRPVLLEKSPTNAGRTRWLQERFDSAYFLGIIRSGYAVAEGIRRKAGHSIELAAKQWRISNEILLDDFEHLEHRMLIRYEDLVTQLQARLREISAFIGVDEAGFGPIDRRWQVHEQDMKITNLNQRSLSALTEDDKRIVHEDRKSVV